MGKFVPNLANNEAIGFLILGINSFLNDPKEQRGE